MSTELTNLLPAARRASLARDYRFRFGVAALAALVALIFCAGALLVPTYVFLAGTIRAKEVRLASVRSTMSSADEKALAERLSMLSNNVTTLSDFSNGLSASGLVRSVLAVPRPGVVLSGFVYTSGANKSDTLAISGTAATRDVLRRYQLSLQEVSFVRTADLPVSAYAKDAHIPFTITLTLSL